MRYLIFILWILLGIAYWFIAEKHCCDDSSSETISERIVTPVERVPIKKLTPISFDCKDDKPNLATNWETFRDSLIGNLGENQLLQVKGYEFDAETDDEKSLALARATNVRRLFALPENKVKLATALKGDSCLRAEMSNLVEFRFLKNSAKIKEIDDRTRIYFKANSTQRLDDAEIEAYLDDVAERVKRTGEKVRLTGHTDRLGAPADNLKLGQGRANVIKNYLVSKGVPAKNIFATSKGELEPIADNNTADGRQQNRRTELQIIK